MKKATRNYFLAVVMFVLGLFVVVSGFVIWLDLLRGRGYMGGRGLASEAAFLWTRDTWIALHTLVGIVLVVVAVVHLVLHWKWILRMTKRLGRPKV